MKIKITTGQTDPLQELFKKPLTFQQRVEAKKLRIVEMILRQMETLGLNRTKLAKNMGVGSSRITSMLDGTNNFTLETIMRAAEAVESEVDLTITPKTHQVRWIIHQEEDCHPTFSQPKAPTIRRRNPFALENETIAPQDPCHAA